MTEHYLDHSVTQPFWDNSIEPRLEIDPGDTVVIDCAEPCGQVTPDWTSDSFAHYDPSKSHALTGSIFVKGAMPGDALEVEGSSGLPAETSTNKHKGDVVACV